MIVWEFIRTTNEIDPSAYGSGRIRLSFRGPDPVGPKSESLWRVAQVQRLFSVCERTSVIVSNVTPRSKLRCKKKGEGQLSHSPMALRTFKAGAALL